MPRPLEHSASSTAVTESEQTVNPALQPMERDREVAVRLEHVGKTFDEQTVALKDVSLEIEAGEIFTFVGPSGCGKTTLLRMTSGLEPVTSGRISVLESATPSDRKENNEFAYVFQSATLLPWRSVIDNVSLPLELKGVPRKQRFERAGRVIDLVDLYDYRDYLPRQLSGGMQMRVSIARALVAEPRLLLMDEPFGALDEITRQNLQNELLKIWETKGITILFVTHNVFEAVFLSTRVGILTSHPGRLSDVVSIDFDGERNDQFRAHPAYNQYVGQVSRALKH